MSRANGEKGRQLKSTYQNQGSKKGLLSRRQAVVLGSAAIVTALESCASSSAVRMPVPSPQPSPPPSRPLAAPPAPPPQTPAPSPQPSPPASNSGGPAHARPTLQFRARGDRTVKPGDNLKQLADRLGANQRIVLRSGTYQRYTDIRFNVPTEWVAENWRPGMTSGHVVFDNAFGGGSKGVFEAGRPAIAGALDAQGAWNVFRGIHFKNLRGTEQNFSAIRGQKGNLWIEDCIVEESRSGVLAQIKSTSGANDGPNGAAVVFVNCTFIDCGNGGKNHGIYVRAKHTYLENCEFRVRPGYNAQGHDIKSLSGITTVKNCRILSRDCRISTPIDISGQGGDALIEDCTIYKGKNASNRHVINYRWDRLGNQWAQDRLIVHRNVIENYMEDAGAAIPRVMLFKNQTTVRPILEDNVIANKASGSQFRLVDEADWNANNTTSGDCRLLRNGSWVQV